MKDRVSLYPGRVKLTPVSGQENTYDMVRADEPTQEGTPLNKATLLKDATAALFGMDENAVPNDIFEYIYGLFPSNTSTIRIYVEDQYSRPFYAKVTISPTIDNKSVFYTLPNGYLTLPAPEGTYTITLADNIFYTCTENEKSVTVVNGTQSKVNFTVNSIASGKAYLKSSGEMWIPTWIKPDLFAVGGGGGGGFGKDSSSPYWGIAASGGAGGCTKTILRAPVNGKKITYIIGNGGSGVYGDSSVGVNGGSGGTTSVTCQGETIISASGGNGGIGSKTKTVSGASGGSGSGGVVDGSIGNAGSDGSNGGSTNGGSGQGTTTREFGESDGELYCGAGGGATMGQSAKAGGGGGGGSGASDTGVSSSGVHAGDGTKYGAGGGASGLRSSAYSARSGNGYQGVLVVRWNEEDAV